MRRQIDKLLKSLEREFVVHNRIEISKSALRHNLALFKHLSSQQVIPVLKGNAYGHGVQQVATALKGQDIPYIAVDGYFEALRVREVTRQSVLVMGAILPKNFKRMKYDNFAFVVGDEATIHALGKTGKKINVHLECNTGMNRYGAKPDELEALTKLILRYKNLYLEGVMSHLADSDGENPKTVQQAVERFDECVRRIRKAGGNPAYLHVAQSAGSLKALSKYANTIRLGVGLYGINPFPVTHELHKVLEGLRPAMQLISTITKVIELKKGDKVGYNYTYTAPRKMKIGVIPMGYFEGVNRDLSSKGVVKIGGKFAPIVGRVNMNHTMFSLEGIDAAQGDEVVVYSDNLTDPNAIDQIAKTHNLFSYNLLTSLSQDVRHILVK